ncbi:MAG: hypothetical protein PHS44_06380 [Candidatus Dojkabacteria bacterium]|jgi:hypothetical protein|nr:hypothetical protein [Candidatus Dojkabacteria bacterium]
MNRKENKDTRYFVDLDLERRKIVTFGYGNRYEIEQKLEDEKCIRIFITKGQYNKLEKKQSEIKL